jgi:hypothetical protein
METKAAMAAMLMLLSSMSLPMVLPLLNNTHTLVSPELANKREALSRLPALQTYLKETAMLCRLPSLNNLPQFALMLLIGNSIALVPSVFAANPLTTASLLLDTHQTSGTSRTLGAAPGV